MILPNPVESVFERVIIMNMKWFNSFLIPTIAVMLAGLLVPGYAHATLLTYEYTGNKFNLFAPPVGSPYEASPGVTGSVTFDDTVLTNGSGTISSNDVSPNPALISASFSDGIHTLDTSDSHRITLILAALEIIEWDIRFANPQTVLGFPRIRTINGTGVSFVEDSGATNGTAGAVLDNPGVWTKTTSVSEPSTLALITIGLVGVGFAGRRKKASGGTTCPVGLITAKLSPAAISGTRSGFS